MLKIINPSPNTYDTMLFISLLQKGKSTSSKSMGSFVISSTNQGGGGGGVAFALSQHPKIIPTPQ
jgi:hypothetical protein